MQKPFLPSSAVSEQLKQAVDFKLFELSAHLINPNVHSDYLIESLKWFQPRHAEEVIEERHCSGICGYPLCDKPIKSINKSSPAKYRINYYEKKIFEIEKSIQYCSVSCLEKSEIWLKQLDISLPYGRPVAKPLKKANYKPTHIDEVLGILTSIDEPNLKISNRPPPPVEPIESIDPSKAPPPIYKAPSHLSDRGEVLGVQFVYGQPVLPTPYPFPPAAGARRQGQSAEDTEESNVASSSGKDVPTASTPPTANTAASTAASTAPEAGNIPPPPLYEVPSPPSKLHPTPITANINDIMKTMKELQVKHGLLKTSPPLIQSIPKPPIPTTTTTRTTSTTSTTRTTATPSTLSTNHSIDTTLSNQVEKEVVSEVVSEVVVEVAEGVDDGEDNEEEEEQTRQAIADMQSFNVSDKDSALTLLPRRQGTRKTVDWSGPVDGEVSTVPSTTGSGRGSGRGSGGGGNRIMSLQVIEHSTAQPLSLAALPTKREPPNTTTTTTATMRRYGVDGEGVAIGVISPFTRSSGEEKSSGGGNPYPRAGGIEGYLPNY